MAAGHQLFVSPFDSDVRRTTQGHVQNRNEFVAALSATVLIPHAPSCGKAEAEVRKTLKSGKLLFMFDGDRSADVSSCPVRQYNLAKICDAMTSDVK